MRQITRARELATATGVSPQAVGDELVDAFRSNQEQGLVRSAVDVGMRPTIAVDAFDGDHGFWNWELRDAAGETVLTVADDGVGPGAGPGAAEAIQSKSAASDNFFSSVWISVLRTSSGVLEFSKVRSCSRL